MRHSKESNFHKTGSSKRRRKSRRAKFVLLQFRFISDRSIDAVRADDIRREIMQYPKAVLATDHSEWQTSRDIPISAKKNYPPLIF